MSSKRQSGSNPDIFGTFLKGVTGDAASIEQTTEAEQASDSMEIPSDPNPNVTASSPGESAAVALLIYLLENGPQAAGPMLTSVGMALDEFFVASQLLKERGLVNAVPGEAGEIYTLTELGVADAERWQATLRFMR